MYAGPPSRLGRLVHYALMRAKVRLAYRADFVTNALGDAVVSMIGIVFLWALFGNVPDIVGWSFAEVLFIWGSFETAMGLFFVSFQGLWLLNQRYLLQGELDRVLLRPVDPYLQILLDNLNVEDLSIVLVGFAILGTALVDLPPLSPLDWLRLVTMIGSGVLVLGGVLTLVSAVGFLVHHRGTAIGMVYQSAAFGRYPLDIFHRTLRLALTWVLPFGFIAFYPATHFLGRDEWSTFALVQPLVGVGVMTLGYLVWSRAIRAYRSTGS